MASQIAIILDNSKIAQKVLSDKISQINTKFIVMIIHSISDQEIMLYETALIHTLCRYMEYENKNLSQAATACLMLCYPNRRQKVCDILEDGHVTNKTLIENLLKII